MSEKHFIFDYEEITRKELTGNHVHMSRALDRVITNLNSGHPLREEQKPDVKRLNKIRTELLYMPNTTNFADHFVEIAHDEMLKNSAPNRLVYQMLEAVNEIDKTMDRSQITVFLGSYTDFDVNELIPNIYKFSGNNPLLLTLVHMSINASEEKDIKLNEKLSNFEPTETAKEQMLMDCELRKQACARTTRQATKTVRAFKYVMQLMDRFDDNELALHEEHAREDYDNSHSSATM